MDRSEFQSRNLITQDLLGHFSFDHLKTPLRGVSEQCANLAYSMVRTLPDGDQLYDGLRNLLRAKDCFVRQAKSTAGSST
jgi:hypothetical protein